MIFKPETILDRSDMELSRSPNELFEWINQKCEQFMSSHEAKVYARSGKELPKKFYEEIRPLSLLVSHLYPERTDVTCTPNLGDENYDATIHIASNPAEEIFVEFTYAKCGHDESLRLEVLNDTGGVNMFGKITVYGTKASGFRKIEIENSVNSVINLADILDKNLSLIKTRTQAKSKKEYGSNHILVIIYDDYISIRSEEDIAKLKEVVKNEVIPSELDFKALYLLGASGHSIHEFSLPKYSAV